MNHEIQNEKNAPTSILSIIIRILCILVLLSIVVALLRVGILALSRTAPPDSPSPVENSAKPYSLKRIMPRVGLDANSRDLVLDKLKVKAPCTLSTVLHAMRIFGADVRIPHPRDKSRSAPAINVILDYSLAVDYFQGNEPLIDTNTGVRVRQLVRRNSAFQPEREAHSGQLLAVFAELGIPTDRQLTTSGGTRKVGDILSDSIANFDLNDTEIEWTGVGIAMYLAPRSSWTDKFGRPHTCTHLADRLLRLSSTRQGRACYGSHVVHALAILSQIDRNHPILSAEARSNVNDFLNQEVSRLRETQSSNGSWSSEATGSPLIDQTTLNLIGTETQSRAKLVITGHSLEWLLLMEPVQSLNHDQLGKAVEWCFNSLMSDSDDQVRTGYCPYSHAGNAVVLSKLEGGIPAPRPNDLSLK